MEGKTEDKYSWVAVVSIAIGVSIGFIIDTAYTLPAILVVFIVIALSISER